MPDPLVECIPNFSEARRPEVIASIIQSIRSVPQVSILDQHSDYDHNRTVVTLIGPPPAVEEAVYRAIEKAAQLIDLNQHKGEHPAHRRNRRCSVCAHPRHDHAGMRGDGTAVGSASW